MSLVLWAVRSASRSRKNARDTPRSYTLDRAKDGGSILPSRMASLTASAVLLMMYEAMSPKL